MKTKIIILALGLIPFLGNAQDAQKTLNDAISSKMMDNVTIAVDQMHTDVNKQYKDKLQDNYPIHTACFALFVEGVEFLIAKKVDLNVTNKLKFTPLNMVCYSFIINDNIIKIIDLLVANGADINAVSGGGHSSLAYAAERNNMDAVTKLLALKADPNARKGKISYTPLMHAAKKGNLEMVKALVVAGADVNEAREYVEGNFIITENALSMSSEGGFTEVVEYLQANKAKKPVGKKGK